jgi:hypothetical protein
MQRPWEVNDSRLRVGGCRSCIGEAITCGATKGRGRCSEKYKQPRAGSYNCIVAIWMSEWRTSVYVVTEEVSVVVVACCRSTATERATCNRDVGSSGVSRSHVNKSSSAFRRWIHTKGPTLQRIF